MDQQLKYQGLIASCGMNCGLCIGFLRKKNPCAGCFKIGDVNKPKSCRSCAIANCEKLVATDSGLCYECQIFPCARLKRLDKRYRTKYGMSMVENLNFIKKKGMEGFLKREEQRWVCKFCGEGLCVHRSFCFACKAPLG